MKNAEDNYSHFLDILVQLGMERKTVRCDFMVQLTLNKKFLLLYKVVLL